MYAIRSYYVDRALDIVFRHRGGDCLVDGQTQARIAIRITAAVARGDAVSLPGINDLGVFTDIAFAAGDPVPTVSAEEEPEDSGGKGLNYRTEPSWFRLGYARNNFV